MRQFFTAAVALLSPTSAPRAKESRKGAQMESIVNDYISREIVQDPALLPLSNETSLLEAGILDSLGLLKLVVFLGEQFKITIGEADLLPENFDSVNTICAYLRAREPGRQEERADNVGSADNVAARVEARG
jgi:acyl carrier protein